MGSSAQFKRLGVYFTAPKGTLAAFGGSWLGWDIETGQPVDHPSLTGIPIPISVITATAHKYGFHGTLKAPFALAAGKTQADVELALEKFCKTTPPLLIGRMTIVALGRFLALVPKGEPDGLKAFAGRIVDQLEPFRAPISEAEFARKDADYLSSRQRENLKTYGYAYVHEDFKFHMTLTDRLSKPHLAAVQDVLSDRLADMLQEPLTVDAVSLVGEREDGQFQVIQRFTLTS